MNRIIFSAAAIVIAAVYAPFAKADDQASTVQSKAPLLVNLSYSAADEEAEARCWSCAGPEEAATPWREARHRMFGRRWSQHSNFGMVFNANGLQYGLWGDVREINNIANIRSTSPSVGPSVGAQVGDGLAGSAIASSTGIQNVGAASGAGSALRPGRANFSAQNFSGASSPDRPTGEASNLSYREYVGGLFVARPF